MKRFAIGAILLMALAACHKNDAATAPSAPPMAIDDRGIVLPLEEAVTKISYRPWVPPVQVIKWAVIPPLGGNDTPANRGVAAEYQNGQYLFLLSQWQNKLNFPLTFLHGTDITSTNCVFGKFAADGFAWTSKHQLVMTIMPDGTVPPKDVEKEARRLLAAGACK